MPAPNYPLPDLGELNSIADPKVRSALAQILAWANGGIESGALDTATRQLLPSAGDIRWTAKTQLPVGWLVCDGRAVLRTEYPLLFAAIGTTYGSTGPTDFRVPDLAGRLAMGAGLSKNQDAGAPTVDRALAARGGRETVLLTSAQSGRPAGQTDVQGRHNHSLDAAGNHSHGGATGAADRNLQHSHSFTSTAGGGVAAGGLQAFNKADGGTSVTRAADHTHAAATGYTAQNGIDHLHGITADGNHSHTLGEHPGHAHNLAAADASTAHENMPPFTALHALVFAG